MVYSACFACYSKYYRSAVTWHACKDWPITCQRVVIWENEDDKSRISQRDGLY